VGRREDPAAPAVMERKFARAAVNCDMLLILNECEHSSEDLFAGANKSQSFLTWSIAPYPGRTIVRFSQTNTVLWSSSTFLSLRAREREKFITRKPPIEEKDDYDSENSWISDGLPSSSSRRRTGGGRGEGGEWREKWSANEVDVGVDGAKSEIKVERSCDPG